MSSSGKATSWPWKTVLYDSTAFQIFQVAAGSPQNLWATHLSFSQEVSGQKAHYTLLRNAGHGWRPVPYPDGIAGTAMTTAVGDDDTWFLGRTSTGTFQLLRYHDDEWTTHPLETQIRLTDLQATGANGVWVAGEADVPVDDPDDEGGTPFLRHFTGGDWTDHPLPEGVKLVDVVRRTDEDVWAFGRNENDARAVALQWNGEGWTDRSPDDALFEVHCGLIIDPVNVWILGRKHTPDGPRPVSWRYDGVGWSESTAPVTSSGLLQAIGDGHGGVWASGTFEATIVHHAAGTWRRFKLWPGMPGRPGIEMVDMALIPGSDRILIGARWEYRGRVGVEPPVAGVILTT